MNVQDLQTTLLRRLLLWGAASFLAGLVLLLLGDAFWHGFGLQAIGWGLIDGLIALAGLLGNRRRINPTSEEQALRRFRRVLLINAGLDLLYIAGGLALVLTLGASDGAARGHGWGIVVQGAFLLFFDLGHTRLSPATLPPLEWLNVQGPEHRTFHLPGGRPAALLIHGFPSTPAELRALGQSLQRAGWTARGLLLPGFGPEIETLPGRRWEEWQEAILAAQAELRREHAPLLVIGYSLGGALALAAAAQHPPDGLILLAPFIWHETWWQRALSHLITTFLVPAVRPFRWLDLRDPRVQREVQALFPHADVADPQVQEAMRRLAVPLALADQVRRASQSGYRAAVDVAVPTLIVQGSEDPVSLRANTRRLLQRLRQAEYREIPGGHGLDSAGNPTWPAVEQAVLEFAARMTAGQ